MKNGLAQDIASQRLSAKSIKAASDKILFQIYERFKRVVAKLQRFKAAIPLLGLPPKSLVKKLAAVAALAGIQYGVLRRAHAASKKLDALSGTQVGLAAEIAELRSAVEEAKKNDKKLDQLMLEVQSKTDQSVYQRLSARLDSVAESMSRAAPAPQAPGRARAAPAAPLGPSAATTAAAPASTARPALAFLGEIGSGMPTKKPKAKAKAAAKVAPPAPAATGPKALFDELKKSINSKKAKAMPMSEPKADKPAKMTKPELGAFGSVATKMDEVNKILENRKHLAPEERDDSEWDD